VLRPADFVFALVCFVALVVWKAPPWMVVIAAATLGAVSSVLG
jgi:chromate transporter